jgi:hypothetical protein
MFMTCLFNSETEKRGKTCGETPRVTEIERPGLSPAESVGVDIQLGLVTVLAAASSTVNPTAIHPLNSSNAFYTRR